MRIKCKGSMTAKELCLLLMKTLAEQGVDHFPFGASLYFGSDKGEIEVSLHQTYDPKGQTSRGGGGKIFSEN